jgi:hypothetical protein
MCLSPNNMFFALTYQPASLQSFRMIAKTATVHPASQQGSMIHCDAVVCKACHVTHQCPAKEVIHNSLCPAP